MKQESTTAWRGKHRLARVNPIWYFVAAIALLAFFSMLALNQSGSNDLVLGMLVGGWVAVLVGFSVYLWLAGEERR